MRRVGEALAGRYTEIGQAIAERAFDEIPGYTDAPPELINDLRAGATATTELLARTLAEGATVRREDLGFLRELAARRVHQGISLEAFIRAYRVALLAIWDACAEEASRLQAVPSSRLRARQRGDRRDRHHHDPGRRGVPPRRDAAENAERSSGPRSARAAHRRAAGRPSPARIPLPPGWSRPANSSPSSGASSRLRSRSGTHSKSPGTRSRRTCRPGPPDPSRRSAHGELVLITPATSPRTRVVSLRAARQRAIDEHNIDVHYGVSVPSQGFASVHQAYREAALSLSYTSPGRPIVSLDDLSSLECALIGATATTKAIIASKANNLRASSDDLMTAVETIRAFADADLNVANAAKRMDVHPNTVRYRLAQIATKTGLDARTFAGLVDLICILEITDSERQP